MSLGCAMRAGYLQKLILIREIVATYVKVRWRLRRSGLDAALAAARRSGARPRATRVPSDGELRFLANGVERTLRPLPFDSRCLSRSLVLIEVLARRGVDSSLVLAARSNPEFEAHSWVEHE